MKWLGRILYIFLIFIIGFYVLNYSNMKKRYEFFVNKTEPLIENYNREEFMKYFMTASNVKDYLNKPVYLAKDEDEKIEFSIYHGKYVAKGGQGDLLFFNFRDIDQNIIETMLHDGEKYKTDNFTAYIKIEVYMDDKTKPVVDTLQINKQAQMPTSLIEMVKVEEKDKFRYIITDDAGKQVEEFGDNITKIELTLVDKTNVIKEEDKGTETKLITITNNQDAVMNEDVLIKNSENVLLSSNFNGNVNSYLLSETYSDETKGVLVFNELDEFNYVVRKNLTTFSIITAIITYLLFFLKPTIKYAIEKEWFKKKEKSLVANEVLTKDISEVEVVNKKED